MRTQEERDRETVRIVMVLPLVVLALVFLVAPIIAIAATFGLLNGVGTGMIPFLVVGYFVLALVQVARRHD